MGELPLNQILCGDCAEVLKDFPDYSIDLVVTDPPYGLSFMGKDWDKTLPPRKAINEIFRVLKPGALAFFNCTPRQDLMARMILLLENSGFETKQSFIDWIYKTGFPKAYDVSKGIDRKHGLLNDRNIKGYYTIPSDSNAGNKGKEYLNPKATSEQFGIKAMRVPITEPVSNIAKKWDGWKSQTGLKPAHEPILMVNKPFSESTIVDNVLKWGTGAINVDACRIPFQNNNDMENANTIQGQSQAQQNGLIYSGKDQRTKQVFNPSIQGRFPANLLVSDKAIDTGELSKSGVFKPHHQIAQDENGYAVRNVYGKYGHVSAENQVFHGDVGDQSRYFDLDAWAEHHGFLDVPKPDNSERDFGLYHAEMDAYEVVKSEVTVSVCRICGKQNIPLDPCRCAKPDWVEEKRLVKKRRKKPLNTHPTVKPIKLMAYLIELGCPPDGVVLDPFMGSGTTCIAAKQLLRNYIGIEINPKYYTIAKTRTEAHPIPPEWIEAITNKEVSDEL